MKTRTRRIRLARFLVAAAVGLVVLGGCSSEGVKTSCTLNSCTLTFDRGASANTEILGVKVELLGAQDDQVRLKVGGQEVTLGVNQSTEVGGMQVTVQSVTADEVVVKVTRASGG